MKKKKRAKYWTYSVEDLTAFERTDRGGQVWTRVRAGKKYRDKRYLCDSIRGADGKIDPVLETKAQQLAIERQKAHAATDDAPEEPGSLTLGQAVRLMLHPTEGKFPGEGGWKSEVARHLRIVARIVGTGQQVADIRHRHYRSLWRTLAHEHKDEHKHGLRVAEMICGSLRSLMVWLAQEGRIEPGACMPAQGWNAVMRQEWVTITEEPTKQPSRPRYSDAETEKLWAALPQADQRLRIAVELGAELRLGQVKRARRSDIRAHRKHELGLVDLRPHGRGKKMSEVVILTDAQRAVLTEAMTDGVLSDLEAAYKRGEIPDYLLVQGEFMRAGKAQVKNAMAEASDRAFRQWWRKLEKLAGVPYVRGRGWYGERRRRIQDGELDTIASATAKNRMSGHTHTQTREIYVGTMDEKFLEEAKELRERTRPHGLPLAPPIILDKDNVIH